MRSKKIISALTILYVLMVTILSLIKLADKPESLSITYFDKIVHFGFYFIMNSMLLSLYLLRFQPRRFSKMIFIT